MVDNQQPSLIDNIFSNNIYDEISGGNIYLTLSEHFSQFASISREKIDVKKMNIYDRDFSNYSPADFRDVSIQSWNLSNIDANCLFSDFLFKLKGCADRHAPIKKLTNNEIKLKARPWISPDLAKMIRIKNKLFRKKKRQPSNINTKILYNRFRNRVNRELKKAKQNYYTTYFTNHSNDIKKTWQGIRSLVNVRKTQSQGLSHLEINGVTVDDSNKISNHVNDFFVNIGPELDSKISHVKHVSFSKYLKNRVNTEFKLTPTSNDEILKIIQALPNKSTGPASIPLKMLKTVADIIVTPLCHIINVSFNTGVFPEILKIAKVIPIHKGGSTLDLNNYRPISLLSIFDKIIEKIMHNQLYAFLEYHEFYLKTNLDFVRTTRLLMPY